MEKMVTLLLKTVDLLLKNGGFVIQIQGMWENTLWVHQSDNGRPLLDPSFLRTKSILVYFGVNLGLFCRRWAILHWFLPHCQQFPAEGSVLYIIMILH